MAIATALDVTLDSLLCDSLPKTDFYLGAIEMELRKCSPEELRVVEATIKALIATMQKQFSSSD